MEGVPAGKGSASGNLSGRIGGVSGEEFPDLLWFLCSGSAQEASPHWP